jgi:hypothetical protein
MRDHLQRQRHLRLETSVRFGNAGLLAALRIITPALRQIQPLIDQRHAAVTTQRRKYSNLAIVHLAQTPAPLPGDTHGMLARLLESAFIDQQATVRTAAQPVIRFQRHLIHDLLMLLRRVREHLLELLFIGLRNPLLHTFHILLIRIGLHQTPQIVTDRLNDAAGCVLKMRFEPQMKSGKAPGKAIKWIYMGISRGKSAYA